MPEKVNSIQVTRRFLESMNRILADRSQGKRTMAVFAQDVGLASSNISRMQANPHSHYVTIEALVNTVELYNVSAHWLLTGEGEMFSLGKIEQQIKDLTERVSGLEDAVAQLESAFPKKPKKR